MDSIEELPKPKKSGNGETPAYPMMDMNSYEGVDRLELRYSGMTKRETFAMAAMQGILAAGKILGPEPVSETAIEMADELLKQLES